MKLKDAELAQLVGLTGGRPIRGVVDDACEILTLKIILVLKKKRNQILSEMEQLERGSDSRGSLATQANLIGRLIVELAEAE